MRTDQIVFPCSPFSPPWILKLKWQRGDTGENLISDKVLGRDHSPSGCSDS